MEKVCIIVSTYNGENYVREQLDSLLAQEHVDTSILVRDDGSTDRTVSILREYAKKFPNVRLLDERFGENLKPAHSFAFLLERACKLYPDVPYFFFSDQDDYWLPFKCYCAVTKLQGKIDEPALYFSKKKLVDANLKPLEKSDVIKVKNNFWDYFDKSNVSGCTMCLTRPLAELLENDDFYRRPFLHDNYIYRLCLSAGIPVLYDPKETIFYRQHGKNVVGAVRRNVFSGIRKLTDRNRVHVVRQMSGYIIRKHDDILVKKNSDVLKLFLRSENSIAAKWQLICKYCSQSSRDVKDKLLFSALIITNYF